MLLVDGDDGVRGDGEDIREHRVRCAALLVKTLSLGDERTDRPLPLQCEPDSGERDEQGPQPQPIGNASVA